MQAGWTNRKKSETGGGLSTMKINKPVEYQYKRDRSS